MSGNNANVKYEHRGVPLIGALCRSCKIEKLIAASVLVLLVAGSIELWPRSESSVVGTLSARDVAAISRIVRAEMWREVLPNLSWAAIKDLPSSIRRRWSERSLARFGVGSG
jgi:hypothetical protein